jgi:beta-lactamase regulating signal transducer with metallopeptidase domain
MMTGLWEWMAGWRASAIVGFLASQAVFSAILFAAVLPLTRICGRRCRLLAMGLWSLVFVRLLLPANLSSPFSGRMLIESAFDSPHNKDVIITVPEAANQAGAALETAGFATSGARDPGNGESDRIPTVLFWVWLSGALAAGAAYATRLKKYERIARDAESCSDVRLLEILGTWRRMFHIRRPVRLAFGPCRISPFTVGILRPVIVLPNCMRPCGPEETIEPVIAHEMAHIRHWDDLWIRLQNLVQIAYFFNPVVWLAGRQVHQLREESRDASVLAKRPLSGRLYGTALLETIRMRLEPSDDLVLLPSFADEKTRLIKRLQNIKQPVFHGRGHLAGSCLLLAAFGFFVLPMARPARPSGGDRPHFVSPVPGGIIYLERGRDWDRSANAYYDHKGVDIGKGGKPGVIVAAAAGQVVSDGLDEIFTDYREITICHGNGLRTRYLHLDTLFVRPGDSVEKGQAIGRTSACLHFEVLKDGRVEDPELYLTLPKQLSRKVVKY